MKRVMIVFPLLILYVFLTCQGHKVVYQFDGKSTPYFRDWLLLGPFPNCTECDTIDFKHGENCKGFYRDYLESVGSEAHVLPKNGDVVRVHDPDLQRKWFFYHSQTDKIPFNSIFTPNDFVVAYGFCQVRSDREQKAILSVGSNDGIKVFLNGEKIHEYHPENGRWLQKDNDYVPVVLKKGLNNLLFKVEEGMGDFGLVARLMNFDSTLMAIHSNLDRYKLLTAVAEKDDLVLQFGQPFKITLLNPDEKVQIDIFDKKGKLCNRGETEPGFPLSIPLEKLPQGFLTIKAFFKTRDGNIVTSQARYFKGKLKRHPLAKMLGADLLPMDKNGRQFFPIGTYGAPPEEYENLKKAGYNFVVASLNDLDQVRKAGLYAAIPFHGRGEEWIQSVADSIRKYKNNPAVLCWMLADEPAYNRLDLLDMYKIYNLAYEIDPYHPTYLVITTPTAYTSFGRCCDVLTVDTYPVKNGDILSVGENIASAVEAVEGRQPVWHCGQLFKWPAQRYPTPREHRFMTYSALLEGAKGLLWYTYKGYGQYLPQDAPELWQAHKSLLQEVMDLAPLWMAPGAGRELVISDNNLPIRARLKKSQVGTFIIAVNTSKDKTVTPEFYLTKIKDGTVDVYGEDRTILITDGKLMDTFQPLDVHIYRIETRDFTGR